MPSSSADSSVGEGGMPNWVRYSLVVVGIVIGVFVVLQLVGVGPEHGPSRHDPASGGPSERSSPGGHVPPFDHGGSP